MQTCIVFNNIQAILISEFTTITEVLNKLRISKGTGALKIDPGKNLKIRPNNLGVSTRGRCIENLMKIEAFQSIQKSGELNAHKKHKIRFFQRK